MRRLNKLPTRNTFSPCKTQANDLKLPLFEEIESIKHGKSTYQPNFDYSLFLSDFDKHLRVLENNNDLFEYFNRKLEENETSNTFTCSNYSVQNLTK